MAHGLVPTGLCGCSRAKPVVRVVATRIAIDSFSAFLGGWILLPPSVGTNIELGLVVERSSQLPSVSISPLEVFNAGDQAISL